MAAERKLAKYSNLASNFIFQPIAVENLGAFNLSTLEFLSDLGQKLSSFSGEERASLFSFQRLLVSLQRCNSVLLHDTFVITPALILTFLLLTLGNCTPKSKKNNNNNVLVIGWCVECSKHYQYVRVSLPVSCCLLSQVAHTSCWLLLSL